MSVPCEHVGLDYFDTAPFRFVASQTIAATPAEVFAVFLDGPSWTRWVFAITGVEWTSPSPIDVGSTRTVHMRGALSGFEEFIAWKPGSRMTFRFNAMSKPGADAFAEDYQVTDLGDGRCRVDWVMAMTPSGFGRHTMRLVAPFMSLFIRRTLANFRRYVESRPALETPHA